MSEKIKTKTEEERIQSALKYAGMAIRQLSHCTSSKALRAFQKWAEGLAILGEED